MDAAPAARGVYTPRHPQASPLFRLVLDQLHRLQTVDDDRFAREYRPWRPVVAQVADTVLACGVLEHGFTRIRCDACTHEYLLVFSCKCRDFCPSCHAKRLAIWTQWLDTTLLAPVPCRSVVLTIPKRLRASCLYRRRLLGDLAVGIVACRPTHGSRANWPPHRRILLATVAGTSTLLVALTWPEQYARTGALKVDRLGSRARCGAVVRSGAIAAGATCAEASERRLAITRGHADLTPTG